MGITRDNPYYYSFAEYCKNVFGRRLYRVALDAGFTCPNRNLGTGEGGCIFCSDAGSGEFSLAFHGQELTLDDIESVLGTRAKREGRPGDFIAYFQSFTNTFAPVNELRHLYESALANDLFAGISVATRPDCMGEEVSELLSELKGRYPHKFIWIELGLQTVHEKTALFINRGYSLDVFEKCVNDMRQIRIPVIVHVIAGLPGETKEMVFRTIEYLNDLKISGIKIHLLHIIRGTRLHEIYEAQERNGGRDLEGEPRVKPLSFDEYTDMVCGCLERLSQEIVVHRLTGDCDKDSLVAPMWSLDKSRVINTIRHKMKARVQD